MAVTSISSVPFSQQWYFLASAIITYIAVKWIYRRFFHPLANVPGPFLPAVTKLYQSYYNSRYYLQVEKLHKQYDPIVRITPHEVRIADTESYEKIYHAGSKYWKSPDFYNAFCVPYASVSACHWPMRSCMLRLARSFGDFQGA